MKSRIKKFLNKLDIPTIIYISLSVFTVLLVFQVFLNDHVLESDDYFHHAARTANYYIALKEGQFPPRWAPNLDRGYGYPVFNYTYHLPYFIGSLFHTGGITVQQSMNLTVITFIIIGIGGVFLLARSNHLSNLTSSLLALSFWLNPYSLLTIFWRGAIGEIVFYALVPICLYFFQQTSDKGHRLLTLKILLFGIIWTLMFLSHLPSAIILIIFLVGLSFFMNIHRSKFKLKSFTNSLTHLLISVSIGLLLSIWYIGPVLFERWMVVYQQGSSLHQHTDQFVRLADILNIPKEFIQTNNFLKAISIGMWNVVVLVSALIQILSRKKSQSKTLMTTYLITVFGISLFLMSQYSQSLWDTIQLLQIQQYPWRLLWLVNICVLLLSIQIFKSISFNKKSVLIIALLFSLISSVYNYSKVKGIASRSDFDWYHTADTATSFDEFKPIWLSNRSEIDQELIFMDEQQQQISEDQFKVNTIIWNGSKQVYQVQIDQSVTAIHKINYFPGWQVKIDNQTVTINAELPGFQGLISYNIPKDSQTISVSFDQPTKVRLISQYISLTTLIAVILFSTVYMIPKLKKQ